MYLEAQAIVCTQRAHGEHGAIVRALTPDDGILAGYVRGGRSRRLKPILVPGNLIRAEFRARTEEQLPALTIKLIESRASMLSEALPVAAIEWATTLAAATLPEAQPYRPIYVALDGVLAAIMAAPAARGWATALVRYELLLLTELGFGLDLSACVASGSTEALAYVSPKSGGAVSQICGEPYRDQLLALPRFLLDGGAGDWIEILAGFRLTGHFLERHLLHGRSAQILPTRERLVGRLKRAAA